MRIEKWSTDKDGQYISIFSNKRLTGCAIKQRGVSKIKSWVEGVVTTRPSSVAVSESMIIPHKVNLLSALYRLVSGIWKKQTSIP